MNGEIEKFKNNEITINIEKSIKCRYILQIIFSNLDISLKLSMIIYSKKFQEKLDITIEDYKNVSGKYLILDENDKNKGKEYSLDNNQLIFEGEYLNGKKNGNGKEYNIYNQIVF